MKNYHYFTVPIGILLSVLAVMELLYPLNNGNTIQCLFSLIGIIAILIINIKTRVFTNFNFKKLW